MDKDGPQQVVRKADQLSEQLEPPNFGILLGEQASCLLFHEGRTASVANADGAQAVALPTADTVYVCRERIMVERDTVYKPACAPAAPQQQKKDVAHEEEQEMLREVPAQPDKVDWEETFNVASLAVR